MDERKRGRERLEWEKEKVEGQSNRKGEKEKKERKGGE